MNLFTANDQVGDVVARFPKADDIFKRYQIDFCCGGNRPLHTAIQELALNEEQIIQELNDLYNASVTVEEHDINWNDESLNNLISHIVNFHHAYLNTTLPVLGELTTKILRVHGANHKELAEVHRLFHSLKMEFEQHLIKEETLVFPRIEEFEIGKSRLALEFAFEAVEELEKEHDHCGELLKKIHAVTEGYFVPADACETYDYTFSKLEELESNTFTHVHLENNILFPRLRVARNESFA